MLSQLWGLAAAWVTWQSLLVGVTVLLAVRYLTRKRYRLPPGPRPLPLLGNILGFRGVRFNDKLYAWSKEYGPVITVYLGPLRCVVVSSLEKVTEVLIHKGADFAGRVQTYSFMTLSEGGKDIVAASYGHVWKLQRRLALTALKKYMSGNRLEERIAAALENVGKEIRAQEAPFYPAKCLSFLVYHVISGFLFGESRDMRHPDFAKLVEIMDELTASFESGMLEDIIPPLRLCPTRSFRRMLAADRALVDLVDRYIQEHKERLDPNDPRDVTDTLLLAMKEEGEFQELADPVYMRQIIKDLFIAGLDTTRNTLITTLFFVAALPEVQSKIHEELDRELEGRQYPLLADKSRLPYTEAVLFESMRMVPVVPLGVPHKTMVDTSIGDYEVPRDTMVLINHWALHQDEAYWEAPQEFRPERFLDEEGKMAGKPAAWLPFSMGRRVCLGETVARPELLLLLAGLLRNFAFALAPAASNPTVWEREGSGLSLRVPPYTVLASPRV